MFSREGLKRRAQEWVAFLETVRAAGGPAAYELARDRGAALSRADLTVATVEAIEAEWRDGLAALVEQVPEAAELRAATRTGTPPRQVWGFVGALLRAARERLESIEGERMEARAALLAMTEKWQAAEREISTLYLEEERLARRRERERDRLGAATAREVRLSDVTKDVKFPDGRQSHDPYLGPVRVDMERALVAKKEARGRRERDRVAAATARTCPKCMTEPGRACLDDGKPRRAPHPERFEGLSPSRGAPAAEQPGSDEPTTKDRKA